MSEVGMIILIEGLATAILGSLLHFAYEWSGENKFVGTFAAVNESTWEHIKLALSGVFCCMLVDVWFLGDNPNYWLARGLSFLVPIIVIPIIFYGYTAFTGRPVLMTDILSFIASAFLSAGTFAAVLSVAPVDQIWDVCGMVMSLGILVAYLLLTRFPIRHNLLFEDPITHKYGYDAFRKLFGKDGSMAKKKRQKRKK